jgi:hypothetical protein
MQQEKAKKYKERIDDTGWIVVLIFGVVADWIIKLLKQTWQSLRVLERRTQGMVFVMLSLPIFMLAVYFSSGFFRSEPAVEDSLVVSLMPYELDQRMNSDQTIAAEDILPEEVASLKRVEMPEGEVTLQSRVSQCLSGANSCTIGADADDVAAAFYQGRGGNSRIEVLITHYVSQPQAQRALGDAFQYARETGPLGNYALEGVAEVDFFYSYKNDQATFTWSYGNWVFSVSASSYELLDAAIEDLDF